MVINTSNIEHRMSKDGSIQALLDTQKFDVWYSVPTGKAVRASSGYEVEKEEDLGLIQLGIEYGVELTDEWEAGISAVWDNKWGHYNS